ncbi:cytochrome P450 family protein [Nonomuraea turcica]|uniref:cytochrome P450 family protein n=1 Tax=Nonomuraea sp. G32 TaxID=3067274 RepID=UPI00273C7E09|nr:cytochrome P450 [Nonomuraea sp. G32]MDP4505025.1 cytochrome P450 [Nonomuraea sp. G32]
MHIPLQLPAPNERTSQTIRRYRDEIGPVLRVELPGKVPVWLVTSYDMINEVLANDGILYSKDPRNFAALHDGSIPPDWPLRQIIEGKHLLTKDGADHHRLRGLINHAFTPGRVQGLTSRIQKMTDALLDRMAAEGGVVDLVSSFNAPLPLTVICELFGVPEDERPQIREWGNVLVSHIATPEESLAANNGVLGYLAAFIERKRHEPGDDLTTGLIRAQEDDGDRLSEDEMLWIMWHMLIAGHETTVHLIGNAVIALCSDPKQLAQARTEIAWEQVVEETLRSRTSVVGIMLRYPRHDVQLAGVTIPAGEAIMVGLAGAGTDPARFGREAERFDVTREPEMHLALGRGPHFCLGAPLARLETRIALASLFGRFPELRLAVGADEIVYNSSIITEGPVRLPVVLGPARGVPGATSCSSASAHDFT